MGLRICSGAFRTSSVGSIYVDTDQFPLDLRRQELELRYMARLKSALKNPTFQALQETDSRRFSGTRASKPFQIRLNEDKSHRLGHRVREKKSKKRKKSDVAPPLIDTARLADTEEEEYGMNRPLKKIPRLVQYSDETENEFLKRVNRAAQDIVNESKFEEKFRVEVDRDESGNVVKMKHRKALDDPLLPAKKRAKLEGERREKRKKRRYVKFVSIPKRV
ncbi:uncharacterized protein [Macrobrachium rosenbergii]|uniref:uncharacterized protein n=1 Tax=Macrobrachium rosenbergii TaxID=79674 RepID=UPI0034D5E84D